ncbi:MAG TPA: hypothetical protein VF456_14840, partial [Vicinamibacterales bacterium]
HVRFGLPHPADNQRRGDAHSENQDQHVLSGELPHLLPPGVNNWPQSTQNPQNLKGFCDLSELGG